jgi:zinc transport system substrate-binding protein
MMARAVVATVLILVAGTAAAGAEVLDIWVSLLPQRQMVERLADEAAAVSVLVQPGQSPATYEPTPRQLAAVAEADLLVLSRAPFEHAVVERIRRLAPSLATIDSCRDIELAPIEDHGHDHHREQRDPHVWLDPALVSIQAGTVCEALCTASPGRCAGFRSNLEAYRGELEQAQALMDEALAPVRGRDLYVFHPAYGYLCRRFGLRQVAVEAGGRPPTARRLAELIEGARSSGAHALFVQPQFASATARSVADAMGLELVELDPLAAEHVANLVAMAEKIAATYERAMP